jgi:hypothetical protein
MKVALTVLASPLIFVGIVLLMLALFPFVMVALALDATHQTDNVVYDFCERAAMSVFEWGR